MIVKGTKQLGSFTRGINLYIPKRIASGGGDSGFSPSSIAGLKLWVKADAGVTLSGSNVTAWADQSAQGNNLSVTAISPLFENNIINGKPAIKFNGGRLDGADIVTAKTIYAVIKTFASQPEQYAAIIEATGGSLYSAILENAWGSYFNGERSASNTIPINTSTIIATLSDNGINYSFRRDGLELFAGSNGGGFYSRSSLYVGNDGSNGQPANVYVSEIIIYDNVISTPDAQSLEAYLNSRYAIY